MNFGSGIEQKDSYILSMPRLMRHLLNILFSFLLASIFFIRCSGRPNPQLETPDVDGAGMTHGYNLTELGSMTHLLMGE